MYAKRASQSPPPPPSFSDADKQHDWCWKTERMMRLIDTACGDVELGGSQTCAQLYTRNIAKDNSCHRYGEFYGKDHPHRCFSLWVSLAATTANWTYDPWALAAPAVLHKRLTAFVKHPGFTAVC